MTPKISKESLNNISKKETKLTRTQAESKYQNLSKNSREKADEWINNRFSLYSAFPMGKKLDPKNPEHTELIEEWLKQRDIVMEWDIKWETTTNPRVSKYLSEKTTETPLKVLQKAEGILEQRFTGSEFKQYVQNMINEANVYTNPTVLRVNGRTEYEGRIAIQLANKLNGKENWVANALESNEGRDALRAITFRLPNSEKLRQEFEKKLEPYRSDFTDQQIENQKKWNELFPKLKQKIQENLESEGCIVEKIYLKPFTSDIIEIRASVTKQVEIQIPQSFGTRSDPYTKPIIRTEKKDINIGGFSNSSGRILDHGYFAKHGTIETDWDTQLALGEVAVLIGSGIRVAVSGLTQVILDTKAIRKPLKGVGERVATQSSASELALSDTASIALDDTVQVIKKDSIPLVKRTGERTSIKNKLSEGSNKQKVDEFGDTVGPELSDTVEPISKPSKLPKVKQQNEKPLQSMFDTNVVYFLKNNQQVPDRLVNEIGEDLSRKLYSWGFSAKDITTRLDLLKGQGKSTSEIKRIIGDENIVFEYIRDTYKIPKHFETQKVKALKENRDLSSNDHLEIMQKANRSTKAEIFVADGNIESVISGLEFEKMVFRYNELKIGPGAKRLQEFSRLADQKAKDIIGGLGVSIGSMVVMLKDSKQDTKKIKEVNPNRENKVRWKRD